MSLLIELLFNFKIGILNLFYASNVHEYFKYIQYKKSLHEEAFSING